MPLEIFTNPDARPNIKNISTEAMENKAPVHFDLQAEFSASDLQTLSNYMYKKVDRARKHGIYWRDIVGELVNYKEVDPARLPKLEDDDWGSIEAELTEYFDHTSTFNSMLTLSQFYVLDSRRASRTFEPRWQGVVDEVDVCRREGWNKFSLLLNAIANVDRTRLPEITEADWKGMVDTAAWLNRAADMTGNDGAEILANLVRLGKSLPELTETDWMYIKYRFADCKREHAWGATMWHAANLAVISRAEQKQNQTSTQSETGETNPLPEIRKF